MKIITTSALLLAVFTISCATVEQSSTTKTMDIYGSGVIQYPIVAEIDVNNNKVTGITRSTAQQSIESLKILAINDAVNNAEADILIEPTFNIEKEGRTTTVIVEGFPATYTNFRPITPEDIPLLEVGRLQTASVYETSTNESSPTTQQWNTNSLLVGATMLGGAVILAIIFSN